jgi:hypothetical protein
VVTVPAGAPHAWAPEGGDGARVRVTFSPGADIEEFFDEFFRCARDGRTNKKGMPPFLMSARLGLTHDTYLAGPPVPMQRALFRMLARTGLLVARP